MKFIIVKVSSGDIVYVPISNINSIVTETEIDYAVFVGTVCGDWDAPCCTLDGKPCHIQQAILTL